MLTVGCVGDSGCAGARTAVCFTFPIGLQANSMGKMKNNTGRLQVHYLLLLICVSLLFFILKQAYQQNKPKTIRLHRSLLLAWRKLDTTVKNQGCSPFSFHFYLSSFRKSPSLGSGTNQIWLLMGIPFPLKINLAYKHRTQTSYKDLLIVILIILPLDAINFLNPLIPLAADKNIMREVGITVNLNGPA